MIRYTHTLGPAPSGRGISTIPNLMGRQLHYILADSLSELATFARASNLKPKGGSFAHWDFNLGLTRAIEYCTTGDLAGVAESDALLSKMEEHITMPSTRAVWIDDVAGAFPNVPAYIAGQPLSMRNRTKHQIESAPLAIMVDLGISAMISAQQVRNRGIAILALVRALSAHRPIELWALDFGSADDSSSGTFGSRRGNAVCCGAKIETSPLDLATACYALTHPAFVRQVLFGLEETHHDFQGGWPFRINRALSRHEMEVLLAPVFTHTSETLALPGLHAADRSMTDPEGWLRTQLAEHDPLKLEETV